MSRPYNRTGVLNPPTGKVKDSASIDDAPASERSLHHALFLGTWRVGEKELLELERAACAMRSSADERRSHSARSDKDGIQTIRFLRVF